VGADNHDWQFLAHLRLNCHVTMNALDIILGIVILGAVALETFRGFGRALFDGLALYATLWVSSTSSSMLASSVHIASTTAGSQAILFGLIFVIVGALGIVLSRFVYGSILLNLGMFDHFMGLLAGIAVGLILAHSIVRVIDIGSSNSAGPSIVASSSIGQECLTFDSYHSFVNTLYSETAGHDVKVD